MAGSLCFLTQFMRFHECLFLDVISWIFSSKNDFLVLLTIPLNFLEFEIDLDVQYELNSLPYSSFHQALEHLVILTYLEYFFQRFSIINANSYIILSSDLLLCISEVSMLLTLFLSLLTNSFSSSLFLIMAYYLSWTLC